MINQPSEKQAQYGGINAHISMPENPQGLAFIAPGFEVAPDDPLILTLKHAAHRRGLATVTADLSQTKIRRELLGGLYRDFIQDLRAVIDGYRADHPGAPQKFELIGHCIGGVAGLNLARDYPVSRIIILDPAPIRNNMLESVTCPTDIIVSRVRDFEQSGEKINAALLAAGLNPQLHRIRTSFDEQAAHMFRGNEAEIARIIQSQREPSLPFEPHPTP